MMRPPFSTDEASGTIRIQDAPAGYVELLIGKDGLRGIIFQPEEDWNCWQNATQAVKRLSQRYSR